MVIGEYIISGIPPLKNGMGILKISYFSVPPPSAFLLIRPLLPLQATISFSCADYILANRTSMTANNHSQQKSTRRRFHILDGKQ